MTKTKTKTKTKIKGKIEIIIDCVNLDDKGIIQTMNYTIFARSLNSDKATKFDSDKATKSELIELIKGIEEGLEIAEVSIKTSKGTEVHIVKGKYFRTDGDESQENDLLDSPACDK